MLIRLALAIYVMRNILILLIYVFKYEAITQSLQSSFIIRLYRGSAGTRASNRRAAAPMTGCYNRVELQPRRHLPNTRTIRYGD